jgi:hypothetical protein
MTSAAHRCLWVLALHLRTNTARMALCPLPSMGMVQLTRVGSAFKYHKRAASTELPDTVQLVQPAQPAIGSCAVQVRSSRLSTLRRCGTCRVCLWSRTTTMAWEQQRRGLLSRQNTTPGETTCQVRPQQMHVPAELWQTLSQRAIQAPLLHIRSSFEILSAQACGWTAWTSWL